jgi:hypothetical protein
MYSWHDALAKVNENTAIGWKFIMQRADLHMNIV